MRQLLVVIASLILNPLFSPIPSAAKQGAGTVSHVEVPRYRLIDLGTLGGPNSAETVEFPYINDQGMVVGFADTTNPDPLNPGGFLPHSFRWYRNVFTDLGTLPGGRGSFAIWSNDRAEIVGVSDNGRDDPVLGGPEGNATLWRPNGQVIDLGTLGGTQSLAGDINQRGEAVGVAANDIPDSFSIFGWATQTRATLWKDGEIEDLGTLGGSDAAAAVINDHGQVAGVSYIGNESTQFCFPMGFPVSLATSAFFWDHGKMTELGTLGGTCTSPAGINNRGQVTGVSNLAGDNTAHPFLWYRGVIQDLGTLGGSWGTSNGLNERGDVIGAALLSGDQAVHAFMWRDGVMIDIPPVEGDICGIAHFVNNSGQVVGTSGDCGDPFELHGFLWQRGGSVINLNDFVPAGTDLVITDGETINDRGEIAGSGQLPNGDFHAIVLIPCNEEHDVSATGCLEAHPSIAAGSMPQSEPASSSSSQSGARDSALSALRRSSRFSPLSQFRARPRP